MSNTFDMPERPLEPPINDKVFCDRCREEMHLGQRAYNVDDISIAYSIVCEDCFECLFDEYKDNFVDENLDILTTKNWEDYT